MAQTPTTYDLQPNISWAIRKKRISKTDKYRKNYEFPLVKLIWRCVYHGRRIVSFSSWFAVNQSTFHEDVRENGFYVFVPTPSDRDL